MTETLNRLLVSDKIVDELGMEAKRIVENADYSACPVPGQEKVQKYLVIAITALVQNARNGKDDTRSMLKFWIGKSPWAAAFVVISGMIFYARIKGFI